jgi:hypothetical protein
MKTHYEIDGYLTESGALETREVTHRTSTALRVGEKMSKQYPYVEIVLLVTDDEGDPENFSVVQVWRNGKKTIKK